MPTPRAPFTDPATVRDVLYDSPDRLARRTAALHRAKVSGADAAATITTLAATINPMPRRIVDIGCGRGTTSLSLAGRFPDATLIAVDQSPALLDTARDRLAATGRHIETVTADFHHLRDLLGPADLAVAAFCLYHSPQPVDALAEIGAALTLDGHLIAATKSTDSYQEIDDIIANSGLDGDARRWPSLYQAFHTDNAQDLMTRAGFVIRRRIDQRHTFRFDGLAHLAEYAATIPKYQLPPEVAVRPDAFAEALLNRLPDSPLTTFSTVTYLVAQLP
ncbi:class I SAM-dependent methyltransferase [Actinoplanes sp. NPDC049802]|uniref:class I SAM-dependent methyltransferase n=1 Tax=Actinoplanes sp. NPDC049802 TaxID=3154742 RepID=UPI00340BB199